MSQKHGRPSVVVGHCGLSAVCLGNMVGPLLLQGIVVECCTMYVSEAWQAPCCCMALWVECCMSRKYIMAGPLLLQGIVVKCYMSRKHGGPSVVAGHCGSNAVRLRSMVGLQYSNYFHEVC